MTAKKTDFTKNTKNQIDVTKAIATNKVDKLHIITTSKPGTDSNEERDEYRFSARFTPEQWKFLQELKWRSRKSITAILQDYVENDMKNNPEIMDGIDELNG